jgi:predicted DCC family thiol-disulfide oxidoreductase YuxK
MDTTDWIAGIEARVQQRLCDQHSPGKLLVLYDPGCALCRRCRDWMLSQPKYLELAFLACTGPEARARFGDIPWLGNDLVVVSDRGQVWAGPAAFVICLWALVGWRDWSYRLASPLLAPLAKRLFTYLSSHRRSVAALFEHRCRDGHCRSDISR